MKIMKLKEMTNEEEHFCCILSRMKKKDKNNFKQK